MTKKRKSIHYIRLISIFLIISVLFLTVGWSAFESTMTMDSYAFVRLPSEVRVTGFSVSNTSNGGTSQYTDYNVHLVTANASLPNSDSTITYEVKVTNMQIPSGSSVGIFSATGLPSNLDILSWSSYTLKDKICDDYNANNCGSGAQKTFYITVGYKDLASYDSNNTDYAFDINFDFRYYHDITYYGISGNYPTGILDGDDLEITLNNVSSLELQIMGTGEYLEGTDYTYSNGDLVVTGVDEDLIIRKLPSYTITYNANGGRYNDNSTTNNVTYLWRYNQNNIVAGAEKVPTNGTNILYKWYNEQAFNNEFDKSVEINQSKTVYARWVDAVVEMNGSFYNSINAAIQQITDNSVTTTINLLKNTQENLSISSGRDLLINLQGHTWSNNGSNTLLTLAGKLTLYDGTITSSHGGTAVINIESTGDLTIDDTTVTATANGKQVIYSYGALKVSGDSYISTSSRQRASIQMLAGGSLEITGGTVIAGGTKSAIEAPTTVPITIGDKDGSVDIDSILLQGADYGIIGNFSFYDGTIMGQNGAYSGTVVDKETGRGIITSTESVNNINYEVARLLTVEIVTFNPTGGTLLETERSVRNGEQLGPLPTPSRGGYVFLGWFTDPDNGEQVYENRIITSSDTFYAHWEREYSAQIGQTHYYSVQDAVNAATNNVSTTILLVRDVSEAVNITRGKKIDLDLQGYTLSFNGAAAAIECYGKLNVFNGSITSASQSNASINIRGGGEATIMNVDVLSTGSRQAVYNYSSGKVTIGGNSYISSKTTGSANGSAIERGTVQNLTNGTLIITGGTIVGINQQAVSNEGTMTIGTDDGIVDNSNIEIIGKTYGIKSLSTFNYYDGIAKGQSGGILGTFTQTSGLSTTTGVETIDGLPYYTEYVIAD